MRADLDGLFGSELVYRREIAPVRRHDGDSRDDCCERSKTAAGAEAIGSPPVNAALIAGEKPPSAKSISVPTIIPESLSFVSNISPYRAGHTLFDAL
jgi:hypothetical protein